MIVGPRGSGDLIVNGAAARLAQVGDRVIVIAYALMNEQELSGHQPRVVICDSQNRIAETL